MPTNTTRQAYTVSQNTADATATALATLTPTPGRVTQVLARVVGRKTDGSAGASYIRSATFRTAADGTVTQIGSTTSISTNEDDSAWDATIDTSGGLIRVLVTGAAATDISWECDLAPLEVGQFLANSGWI